LFEALKFVGIYYLWYGGLCLLPMFFWHKAMKDEYFGILCVSVVFGEGYAVFTNTNGILNFICKAVICTLITFIVLIILNVIIGMAIKEGEKEFYKEKQDYYMLKDKNVNELSPQHQTRIKYLETRKQDFESEFKPNRIFK